MFLRALVPADTDTWLLNGCYCRVVAELSIGLYGHSNIRFRPPSATVVSAEPFSHGTGTLKCLLKEMATYRHWSVSLWRDPDDVTHCWIVSPDKTEWRLISATLCGWRRCFVADQLWFMTCIREEEEYTEHWIRHWVPCWQLHTILLRPAPCGLLCVRDLTPTLTVRSQLIAGCPRRHFPVSVLVA